MSTSAPAAMQVKRTDVNPCTVQLDIVCSPEQVEAGFAKAAKEYAKRIKVPGFRPGTAPKAMIEKMIDPAELARSAADEIIRSVLNKAIVQEELKPDNTPSVNVTKFEKDTNVCEFTAMIPLPPVVNLGNYKGLVVSRSSVDVSDAEVEEQLKELQKKRGKQEAVTGRGIQEGDMAVVNIKPAGVEGEGKTFMVIVGQTFPGLDNALAGMGPEELKSASLSFPDNFQEKDWAGKKMDAMVTVRSATTSRSPQLDDEFAQSLKASDVKDLREKVRGGIQRAKEQIAAEMANEQIFDQLMTSSEVHVPDTTWMQVADQRLHEMASELGTQKKSLEEYAKENGMTLEELIKAQQKEAKVHVERAVLIEHIFKAEDMKVDQNDTNRHFLQIAAENQVPEAELSKFAKKNAAPIRNEIIFRTMHTKVVEFLNSHAVEGTPPATSKKKAAAPKAEEEAKPAPKGKKKS